MKPSQDTYPYTATWNSLTPQQQRFVRGRANLAKLPIPDILGADIKAQVDYRAEQVRLVAEAKLKRQWSRLLAKMRRVADWTVTQDDAGVVTVRIGGFVDAMATFNASEYVEALSFYEGYTVVESKPGESR